MGSCEEINELLPEYINKTTTKMQNVAIARHMSTCLLCRGDLALWLSVGRVITKQEAYGNSVNYQFLFDKLPEKETELNKIINTSSLYMAFELIRYAFAAIKATYRLASLI